MAPGIVDPGTTAPCTVPGCVEPGIDVGLDAGCVADGTAGVLVWATAAEPMSAIAMIFNLKLFMYSKYSSPHF